MKQLDKTQMGMINAAIFDDCKKLTKFGYDFGINNY